MPSCSNLYTYCARLLLLSRRPTISCLARAADRLASAGQQRVALPDDPVAVHHNAVHVRRDAGKQAFAVVLGVDALRGERATGGQADPSRRGDESLSSLSPPSWRRTDAQRCVRPRRGRASDGRRHRPNMRGERTRVPAERVRPTRRARGCEGGGRGIKRGAPAQCAPAAETKGQNRHVLRAVVNEPSLLRSSTSPTRL